MTTIADTIRTRQASARADALAVYRRELRRGDAADLEALHRATLTLGITADELADDEQALKREAELLPIVAKWAERGKAAEALRGKLAEHQAATERYRAERQQQEQEIRGRIDLPDASLRLVGVTRSEGPRLSSDEVTRLCIRHDAETQSQLIQRGAEEKLLGMDAAAAAALEQASRDADRELDDLRTSHGRLWDAAGAEPVPAVAPSRAVPLPQQIVDASNAEKRREVEEHNRRAVPAGLLGARKQPHGELSSVAMIR